MKTNNKSRFLWLDYIAIAIIVIAFFVISYCGFFMGDDLWMNHGVSTLSDVIEHTKMFYFTYGGRLFSVASQYLFSGVLGDNRIWYDIVNTLFFVLLIMTCGKLIDNGKEPYVHYVLVFVLLFWFLCPAPGLSLFWAAGSTTYLWANALTFVFLLFFQKYKDDNFSVVGKLGLFIMSIFAATELITCASICGAFVVYYAFHIKKFKGNAVPFVVGFVIGSMVLLFAPGNFERATKNIGEQSLFDISSLLHSPFQELVKYKALWMLLVVFILGWISNKGVVKIWAKNNPVLLLSLGWSIIAFSIVFRPNKWALLFPETLALVLFLRFLFDNYGIIKIRFIDGFLNRNLFIVRSSMIIILFVIFLVDSAFAVVETKRQNDNNNTSLNKIVDSGGTVVLDKVYLFHRMAYISVFHKFANEALADKYGLDSIRIYPYYCLDKYYKQAPPMENIYIDEDYYSGKLGKYVPFIVRLKTEELQASDKHVTFTIDYTRPKMWYKLWLDKLRNYQYDRTEVVEIDNPAVCYDGYCYYFIWLGIENAKNLKSIKYEVNQKK